jgi:hypothetical protein
MINVTELHKSLIKDKSIAILDRYQDGKIFYRFTSGESLYEFPIYTVEFVTEESQPTKLQLSSDLGMTAFNKYVKASELMRWIKIANGSGELKILNQVSLDGKEATEIKS